MATALPADLAPRPVIRPVVGGLRLGWQLWAKGVWPLVWRSALFVIVFVVAFQPAVRLMPLPSNPDQDMSHFRLWTAWIMQNGVEASYAGLFPAQYVIYPPFSPYFFQLVGHLLAAMPSPPEWLQPYWPEGGAWVEAVIRSPVVFFHGLVLIVIYWSTARWKGHFWATVAALAYGFNPAVLFDNVYWAQPDSYHSFFAVVGLLLVIGRWPELGWASLAIAALAKPQAWIYLPVILLVTWRRHGFGPMLSGGVFFVLASLAVIWPYIVSDRFWEMISVFFNFSRVMPVVTANAHNFWWLILGQPGLFKADSAIVIGPFTYQTVGLTLLLAFYTMGLLKAVGDTERVSVFSAAGFMSLSFFMFSTQIHENHAFLVFPMLAMCMVANARLATVYVILTATMGMNLALHDPILEPLAPAWLAEQTQSWPSAVAALITTENLMNGSVWANFAALGIWLSTFLWSGGDRVSGAERARRAAWAGFVGGGTALAGAALALYLVLNPDAGGSSAPPSGPFAAQIAQATSLRPIEEPYLRITRGGGGIDDPAVRRTQTIALALGGSIMVGVVSLGYAALQGVAVARRR